MTWGPTSFPAKNHSSKVWQFSTSLAFFAALTKGEESVTFHLPAAFFAFFSYFPEAFNPVFSEQGGFCNLTMHEPWKRPVCMNLHNGEVLCWAGDPKSMVSSRVELAEEKASSSKRHWLHLRDIAFGASFLSSRGFSVSWSRDQQYHLYPSLPLLFPTATSLRRNHALKNLESPYETSWVLSKLLSSRSVHTFKYQVALVYFRIPLFRQCVVLPKALSGFW